MSREDEEQLRRLIAAAKEHDHPASGQTDEAWKALSAAVEVGAGPTIPIVLAKTAAKGTLGVKGILVVGAAVAMAAGGAAWLARRGPSEPSPAVATDDRDVPPRAGRPADPSTSRVPPRAPPVPPSVVPPEVEVRVPVVPSSGAKKTATPRTMRPDPALPPASDSTLAEQARLLGEAWQAVSRGETREAIARIEEHARLYPTTVLAPERKACQIVAWCMENQPWAASQAHEFLEHHQGTPAARVRRACFESTSKDRDKEE